jgi:hypothetical protein
MFSVNADDADRLLKICWSGKVDLEEIRRCTEQIVGLVSDMPPGYRVLTDMTGLESMDPAGAPHIGTIMDLCVAKQVEQVVRVIPDPQKDIGFNIMSHFHYGSKVQVVTCESLTEALQHLAG